MAKPKSTETHEDFVHPFARKFLWLDSEKTKKNFIWLPLILLIITVLLGFVYPFEDKHKAKWDFFASWGIIGFVAYSFVVISARPLFALLARDESYYGETVEPEIIVEPKVEVHHHD